MTIQELINELQAIVDATPNYASLKVHCASDAEWNSINPVEEEVISIEALDDEGYIDEEGETPNAAILSVY